MAKIRREVAVEFEGHDDGELTITLRGPANIVVGVLVNGMPERALKKLAAEIDKVTAKRVARKKAR
jgi:hypothetical protein